MRRSKCPNVLHEVRRFVRRGAYLETKHVQQRMRERAIARQEVSHVLENGFHEERKDAFDIASQSWRYAIRGRTLEERELRVVVVLTEDHVLVVTAIDLT